MLVQLKPVSASRSSRTPNHSPVTVHAEEHPEALSLDEEMDGRGHSGREGGRGVSIRRGRKECRFADGGRRA